MTTESKQLQPAVVKPDAVVLREIKIGTISVERFNRLVSIHDLDADAVMEIVTIHEGSVAYLGRLLKEGLNFPYIQAAYQLRDEIGSLNDPNGSKGLLVAEFELPIKKGAILLLHIFPDSDDITGESISDVAYMFSQVANECPQVKTWSTIIDITLDVLKSQDEETVFLDKQFNEISDIIVQQLRRHRDEFLDQSY